MSSKAFPARTSHTSKKDQICGLHESSGCSAGVVLEADGDEENVLGAILEGDLCFYLTCRGDQATPKNQIQRSNKKDGYSTGYRTIPSGRTRTVGKAPYTREVPIFKWQELGPDDQWHDVAVWEKMAHVQCAEGLKYKTPVHRGKAHKGARTKGFAHRVKTAPIPVLEELAVIAYEMEQEEKDDA